MEIDLYLKAQELLSDLANSIRDRDNSSNFCFTVNEVRVTEKFLSELVKELNL